MDENKNLNHEEENTAPEAEAASEAEAVPEVSEAEVAELENENTSYEPAEQEEAPVYEDESAVPPLGDSNDTAGVELAAEPKKKKTGLIIGIIAIIAVIIAVGAAVLLGGRGAGEGTGNLLTQGFATIKGNYLYHVDFNDLTMYKTNLKTGESVQLTTEPAVYITKYKNDIYYMGYELSEDGTDYVYAYKRLVDGENDFVIVNDDISSPQLADGYLYYLKSVPEFHSGYSSRLYRVSLKGGEPETVCDALMISYYVDGDSLYYCDVEATSLVKVRLENAVNLAAESPLGEGEKRSAADLGAETVSQSVVTCMARSGNTLYFIDAQSGNYKLCTCNLKNGEIAEVNGGVSAAIINIYGKFLYYYSTTDFCIYRMNLDGSNVTKITDASYGYIALSEDKLMSMEFTDDYKQYIAVCDLDGNVIMEVGLDGTEDETDEPLTDGEADLEAEADGEAEADAEAEAELSADPAAEGEAEAE